MPPSVLLPGRPAARYAAYATLAPPPAGRCVACPVQGLFGPGASTPPCKAIWYTTLPGGHALLPAAPCTAAPTGPEPPTGMSGLPPTLALLPGGSKGTENATLS